ncbi:hypothetical protein HN587_02245 [Candidatus Woesearchaeota archaeon]|jgi:hypothetical protein|nr:hypothetical protein [Candidatus Woesearchaeota archaeon]
MSRQETLDELLTKTEAWIADKMKTGRRHTKKVAARGLYDWHRIKYGFEQNFKDGIFSPFPHEIEGKTSCFPGAVMLYFAAKHAKLDPRFFIARDLEVGPGDISDVGISGDSDHAFIDVDVGNKRRVIIDPMYATYGPVTYDLEKKLITIQDNELTLHTKRVVGNLEEIDEPDLLRRLMVLRTPKGSLKTLSARQRVSDKSLGKRRFGLMYEYGFQDNSLTVMANLELPVIANHGIEKKFFLTNEGSPFRYDLTFFTYGETSGWSYKQKAKFGTFKSPIAQPILDLIRDVLFDKDKTQSRHRKILTSDAIDHLAQRGLSSEGLDLSLLPAGIDPVAAQKAVDAFGEVVEEQYLNFISSPEDFEVLRRSLMVRVLYSQHRKNAVADGSDHGGFISSQEERDKIMIDKLEKVYSEQSLPDVEVWKNFIFSRARIPGYSITAVQFKNKSQKRRSAENKVLVLPVWRRHLKREYDEILDLVCFNGSLGKASDCELRAQLSQSDGNIKSAYKQMVFRYMTYAYQGRTALHNNTLLARAGEKVKQYFQHQRFVEKLDQLEIEGAEGSQEYVPLARRLIEKALYDPSKTTVAFNLFERQLAKDIASHEADELAKTAV